jgi:MinD-like ATPase involved in chromosome partitioning or flagellar assembly
MAAAAGMLVREMAKETGQELRVAVIDNNRVGNIKYYFGFPPLGLDKGPRSMAGFRHLHAGSSLGAVVEAMNYHEPSNVYFVVSPETAHEKLLYNADVFKLCFDLVRKYFHFVFIDMGVDLEEDTAVLAVDAATDIVVVSDHEQDTVGLLKKARGEMGQVFGGFDRVRLVVNQHRKEISMNTGNIVKELGFPLAAELPFCPQMRTAVRKGVPMAFLEPENEYSLAVATLAQKVIGVTRERAPVPGKRIFERVLKKR